MRTYALLFLLTLLVAIALLALGFMIAAYGPGLQKAFGYILILCGIASCVVISKVQFNKIQGEIKCD